MKRYLTFCAIAGLSYPCIHADLQINEVMQSNVHCIMDDINEFPDSWVELYNNGPEAIDLSGYGLSVKDKASKIYRLPAQSLAAGAYVVVYCDKQATGMHTDFRVDSGEGDLFLWKSKEKIETVHMTKMPAADIAYGRLSETSGEWGYQAEATPGGANCGSLVRNILPSPLYSEPGGVVDAPVELTLTCPADAPAGAAIHYTLDGSAPTGVSDVYTTPLHISESTTVRAVLVAEGYMSPLPTTHSYIFHPREHGSTPINQVCETRVKGGWTRGYKVKSLAVYANKRFGTKRFAHEFFHDGRPGVTDFKSIELRNAGQDHFDLYFRDALCQRLLGRNVDVDYAEWQPVILYINGEYIGMLNLRERSNEDFIYTNYDGLEDVDVIENTYTVKEGSDEEMSAFRKFYAEDGHTYEEFAARMDIPEYLNQMIAATLFLNVDFPSNNNICWRPIGEEGRWRWILKDLDSALGFSPEQYDFRYLNWLYDPEFDTSIIPGNSPLATLLFRQLLTVERARNEFIDMMSVYMGDFLRPEAFDKQVNDMSDVVLPEYNPFRVAVGYGERDHRALEEKTKAWYANRVDFMYGHVSEFFKLDAPVPLSISTPIPGISITMNGVPLKTGAFDGKWYPGRQLRLEATGPEAVDAWQVTLSNGDSEVDMIYPTAVFDQIFPFVGSMKITPLVGFSDIEDAAIDSTAIPTVWYDLHGRSLGSDRPSQPGIYLRRAGGNVSKIIVR
ncbi:MAG: hypothetical protein HFJ91_10630 [Muribaculaceae bacterium]|nr:hypothetical protein [Muribaculaceae bacterium]